MAKKSVVAVLRTKPETILADYQRLFKLAGGKQALDPGGILNPGPLHDENTKVKLSDKGFIEVASASLRKDNVEATHQT